MRLEQLQFFLSVAVNTSVTKASEQLFTTPQNVSKAIKQLESELGVKLFHRFKNGMFLTEDGLRAYEIADNILQQTAILKETFSPQSKASAPQSVASLKMLIAPLFNDLLFTILNRLSYHGVSFSQLSVSKLDIRQLNEALFSDLSNSSTRYDCILTCFDHDDAPQLFPQLSANYVGYLIWQDQVCLEMEQSDPLADYPLIPLSLLQTLPMVMYASDGQEKTFTELVFQKRGVTLQVVYRIPSENGKRFAQHHHAYSVIGSPTNELRPHPGHVLVPIEGNIRSNQCLLIPRAKVTQFPLPDLLRIFDDLFSVKKLF